jgi:hypothetical protein
MRAENQKFINMAENSLKIATTSAQHYPGAEAVFFEALAAAQAAFDAIHRTRTVQVALKTGGSYTFAYAPLETILAATVPHLAAKGISINQRIKITRGSIDPGTGEMDEPIHYLVTTLTGHGHHLDNEVMIFKGEATAQAYGSAVTYARRLGVTLLLCVAADDDNDGSDTQMKAPPVQRQISTPGRSAAMTVAERVKANLPKTGNTHLVDPNAAPLAERLEDPTVPYTQKEIADLEGRVVDARDELLQAASEGRRVGIEQIWGEIKANEFIATRVWRALQDHPDLFKVVKDTLKAKEDKTARGPKPIESGKDPVIQGDKQ